MNEEFYSYTIQMQRYLLEQDKRIMALEEAIQSLTKQLTEIKNKPSVNVEKIEYKFDQLKVETLEGTLNIGLNPNDLNNIEELAIPSTPRPPEPYLFPARNEFIEEIKQEIKNEVDSIIVETERQVGYSVDPSYHELIKADLERQLTQRIDIYINQTSSAERSPHQHEQVKQKIIEKLKTDITIGVRNFISNAQNQKGG